MTGNANIEIYKCHPQLLQIQVRNNNPINKYMRILHRQLLRKRVDFNSLPRQDPGCSCRQLTHSSFLKRASLCCIVICMIRIFFFFFYKIRLQDEKFTSVKSRVTDVFKDMLYFIKISLSVMYTYFHRCNYIADIFFILYLFYIVSLIRYISFIYVVRCTLRFIYFPTSYVRLVKIMKFPSLL